MVNEGRIDVFTRRLPMQIVSRILAHPSVLLGMVVIGIIAWANADSNRNDETLKYAVAAHPDACHVCQVASRQHP